MASPISHIVYANNFLGNVQRNFLQEWRNKFIAGSLFPDIVRLLPNASRDLTHNRYSIDLDFSQLDPFHAGWKFHLYSDKAREYFLKKNGFYSEVSILKTEEEYLRVSRIMLIKATASVIKSSLALLSIRVPEKM
jgi:hypothetical protein